MIRPLTLLTLVAAAGAGLHVYQTKHSVSLLDRELRGIARGIEEAETRTQGLHAEWAWLTEQERLRGLAQRHLALEPMQPAQFVRMAEAERRLPPVAAYAGPTALFAAREPPTPPATAVVALLAPRPVAAVQVALAVPPARVAAAVVALAPVAAVLAPPPAAPALAAAAPVEVRPAASVLAAVPRPAEVRPVEARAAEVRAAEARPPEARPAWTEAARLAPLPRAAAPPRPVLRQLPEVAALPPVAAPAPRPAVTQVAAVSVPRPPPTQVAAMPPPRVAGAAMPLGSMLGNALGGRVPLPPPVAFGSANAASLTAAGLR